VRDTAPDRAKPGSRLVRWAAVEAVQRVPGHTRLGQIRDRLGQRRGRNIGAVAAARELMTLVFYGLRDHHIHGPSRRPAVGPVTPAAASVSARDRSRLSRWREHRRRSPRQRQALPSPQAGQATTGRSPALRPVAEGVLIPRASSALATPLSCTAGPAGALLIDPGLHERDGPPRERPVACRTDRSGKRLRHILIRIT
jgi:hypothetical protein